MNNFQTDDFLNMAKDKNQEDVDSQLFLKATQNSSFTGCACWPLLEPGWLQKVKKCRLVILHLCGQIGWSFHSTKLKKQKPINLQNITHKVATS